MLAERLAEYGVRAWLVNTGWTGGPYGTGERMNIDHTRSMVRAALSGALDDVPTVDRPDLRGRGPDHLPGRARPRSSSRARRGPTARPTTARPRALARMFVENFAAYADGVSESVRAGRTGASTAARRS